jgi:DNA-binding transcriptional LysR family regulator
MARQRVDLNLFRVFEAVMLHRSVSGAARELGVTPSAVSHALARLRMALGNELFVPGDGGMEPTARALELAPAVRGGSRSSTGRSRSRPSCRRARCAAFASRPPNTAR